MLAGGHPSFILNDRYRALMKQRAVQSRDSSGISLRFLLACLLLTGAGIAHAQAPLDASSEKVVQNEYIVWNPHASSESRSYAATSPTLVNIANSSSALSSAAVAVEYNASLALSDCSSILSIIGDSTLRCQPNFVYTTGALPNDTDFSSLYAMPQIEAPAAWEVTTGSSNIIVAILDTGIDYTHPDLTSNIWTNLGEIAGNGLDDDGNGYIDDVYGYDFYNEDSDPYDDHGHGTHCAGTLGGVGNNNRGVTGVNWDVALMGLKFMGATGLGNTFDIIRAINYASENGARVINASFGGPSFDPALRDAIQVAGQDGILFVAAAGNNGSNNDVYPTYPANFDLDGLITVAATDSSDNLTWFSNYGSNSVDVAAPGSNILSTVPAGGYAYYSGTSMAAPHVAGLAALLLAANPGLSLDQLSTAILSSVDTMDSLYQVSTGGRINAASAMSLVVVPIDDGEEDGDVPPIDPSPGSGGGGALPPDVYPTPEPVLELPRVSLRGTNPEAKRLLYDGRYRARVRSDGGDNVTISAILKNRSSLIECVLGEFPTGYTIRVRGRVAPRNVGTMQIVARLTDKTGAETLSRTRRVQSTSRNRRLKTPLSCDLLRSRTRIRP